jgi:hypothetical protein
MAIVVGLAYFISTIRIQSTSFAPTALRMFAFNRHRAIVASFHLIDGDARPRAPKSHRWIGAIPLRKFYRNLNCMIFTHRCGWQKIAWWKSKGMG